ncbi:pyrroline-5-carboxylate reductase family protein [Pseudomonas sp. NA-150]|uniref:pyrroline-5-carboxylate reductase family protein n=1 Tax=Pseudomonas sp. NA-150 TaxID=3367525 RepID=UPI0037CC5AE2
MVSEPTIGIIGGSGWLGRSIAQALLNSDFIKAGSLTLSSRNGASAFAGDTWRGVSLTRDNQALVQQSAVVVLSVRPEQFAEVKINAHNRLVISLMAGVALQDVVAQTGSQQVIRAMPNAAAQIGKSYTPWLATDSVTPEQKALTQGLFETCGTADEVFTEQHLDYLTALVGTGPAYPALLARAMLDHALASGLPATIAQRAVLAVVVGASQLIGDGRAIDALLQTLIGYRGVTAAGLEAMIADGFNTTIKAGLDSAVLVASTPNPLFHTADKKKVSEAGIDHS